MIKLSLNRLDPYSPLASPVHDRVPPVYTTANELQPRNEVWPEIIAIDSDAVSPDIYQMIGSNHDRKDSIQLLDRKAGLLIETFLRIFQFTGSLTSDRLSTKGVS